MSCCCQAGFASEGGGGSTPSATLGYGLYADRPAPGLAGSRWTSSDGTIEFVSDGSTWVPMIAGTPGTQVPLAADWDLNFGVISAADTAGTNVLVGNGVGPADVTGLVMNITPGADFIADAHISGTYPSSNASSGIVLRDSATGTAYLWGVVGDGYSNRLGLQVYSGGAINPVSFANLPFLGTGVWLRAVFNGVLNYSFQACQDGVNWSEFANLPVLAIVPDQIGFAASQELPVNVTLDSWRLQ
jgi:hypothetical protein